MSFKKVKADEPVHPVVANSEVYTTGMTKREYAFWQCMAGMLASDKAADAFESHQEAVSAAMKIVNAGFAELNKDAQDD